MPRKLAADRVTPAQELYLEHFEDLLGARTPEHGRDCRDRMAISLNYVLAEAGKSLPAGTLWRDSLSERDRQRVEDLTTP